MRDEETVSTALSAAETGHLILSTLHTVGAVNTIDRIVDMFQGHQDQVRSQLSMILESVVSEQLIPDKEGNLIWIDYGLSSWKNEDGSVSTQFSYVIRFYYKIGIGNLTVPAKDFCLNLLEAAKTIAEDVVYIKTNYNDSSIWNDSGQNVMYTKKSFATAAMADMQQKCNMVIKEDGGVKFSLLINPY